MAKEKGKGSLKHRKLQKLLADYFINQGKIATVEAYIGKNVDILVNDADKTFAVEIQLTSKHCLQIKKDYELGCDEVWFICESTKVLNNIKRKIKTNLDKTLFEKTRFYLIEDFLPHTRIKTTGITRNKIVEENCGIKMEER